ncbi:uncharacterized protein [Argopecten irradians]|uniref:uncharacterized protein n=1 Tax=Argopecten irradians TaxID=31199 RepID=UPI0037109B51
MSQPRIKKRQWRPKPTDNNQLPPKQKGRLITVKIADPNLRESKLKEPEINNSIPTTSPLQVAVYIKEEDNHKRSVISIGRVQGSAPTYKTNTMNADISRDRPAVSVQKDDQKSNIKKVLDKDVMKVSETSAKTSVGDKFHWSRPQTFDDKTTNRLKTKANVSQLAGFLKKQTPPKITLLTKETSAKTSSALQSRTRAEHTNGLDLNSQPLGVEHDKKSPTSIDLDDDFDYSLDLMGDYTLKIKDAPKKPTPLLLKTGSNNGSVQLSTTDTTQTDQSGQAIMSPNNDLQDKQFVLGENDLSDILPAPEVKEYDIIMESRRGYTYHSNSIHRGIKRKIAFDYDDVEDVSPSKRSRMY